MGIFDEPIFPGTEYRDEYGGIDSDLWLELFVRAGKINSDLADRLMYLRNTGCKLVESEKFGFMIVPVIGVSNWENREQYDREKQCLNPYRTEIVNLLRGLRKWSA